MVALAKENSGAEKACEKEGKRGERGVKEREVCEKKRGRKENEDQTRWGGAMFLN